MNLRALLQPLAGSLVFRQWAAAGRYIIVLAPMLAAFATIAGEPAQRVSEEPIVHLRPFKVVAEWMEIQPLLRNGAIESVRIVHVQPRSPAAAAGLRPGMRIVELQGINVVGLSEPEFVARLEALPPAAQLALKVLEVTTNAPAAISIPFAIDTTRTAPSTGAETSGSSALPGPAPSEAETVKQLAAARRALQDEMRRMRAEARATGRSMLVSNIQEQIARELARTLPAHLALLCGAAVKADGDSDAPFLTAIIMNAVTARADYAPEQRAILLKHLPKLPDLIVVLDRMDWLAGAEPAVAAGWKKAREDERDGMLGFRGSRYARLAARLGLADALVAIARTVRNPNAGKRQGGRLFNDEVAILKTLVPGASGDTMAVAEFVLKNRSRLAFDAATGAYSIRR